MSDHDMSDIGVDSSTLSDASTTFGPEFALHSMKDMQRLVAQYKDEVRAVRDENIRLRAQYVDISAMSVKLQQQFAATQSQIDSLKASVRVEVSGPISEQEYFRIEGLPEDDRDLLDTIKICIYQQIGSLKNARDAAVQRGSELATDLEALRATKQGLEIELKNKETSQSAEILALKRQLGEAETRASSYAEMTGRVADLEHKLKLSHVDQEQHMEAKLAANAKTNELASTQMHLKETLSELDNYRNLNQCAEEKLDILKSEYYEMKLKYSEDILKLENALRIAEEKLKSLADVELEAELFITNLAEREEGSGVAVVPASRRMQHAVTVTKRCLNLENQIAALKAEMNHKDRNIDRLQKSVEVAQGALHGTSAFKLVEETIDGLQKENDQLRLQLDAARAENSLLNERTKSLESDTQTLFKHRAEMLKIREMLMHLGATPRITAAPNAAVYGAQPAAPSASVAPAADLSAGIMVAEPARHVGFAAPQPTRADQGYVPSYVPETIEIS